MQGELQRLGEQALGQPNGPTLDERIAGRVADASDPAMADIVEAGGSVESSFPAPPTYIWKGGESGADYEVNNYEGEYLGPINLTQATAYSDNSVFAQLTNVVGPQNVAKTATVRWMCSSIAGARKDHTW